MNCKVIYRMWQLMEWIHFRLVSLSTSGLHLDCSHVAAVLDFYVVVVVVVGVE